MQSKLNNLLFYTVLLICLILGWKNIVIKMMNLQNVLNALYVVVCVASFA